MAKPDKKRREETEAREGNHDTIQLCYRDHMNIGISEESWGYGIPWFDIWGYDVDILPSRWGEVSPLRDRTWRAT